MSTWRKPSCFTRALMGTVRAAVPEDSPVLESAEFEGELARMCWALLVADGASLHAGAARKGREASGTI